MNEPILAKENKQLISRLERDIVRLLSDFENATSITVTNISIHVSERHTSTLCVRVTAMVPSGR